MSAPEKSIEELQAELQEAEGIVASMREQIAQAKWREEYDEEVSN